MVSICEKHYVGRRYRPCVQPVGMPTFDVGASNSVGVKLIGNEKLVLTWDAAAWR
jgi:hypothetical protein